MKVPVIFFILLIFTFLISAKTHGRQHRLERELAGHWSVSFTSRNHPWVEAFWFRQRMIYWSTAAITAILIIVRKWGNLYIKIPVAIVCSMIVAFILTGILSAVRLAFHVIQNATVPSAEWLSQAIWGSAGFWLLTAISVIALLIAARAWKRRLMPVGSL
jgi:hypothetical protein